MTTQQYSTVIDHTSDAGFRAWVAALISASTTAGVVQTADTGQINTATVTRPAVNTSGGYVILRFNDALQATVPIFMKIEFGTGTTATMPSMWITTGTGSNGSGTITGLGSARAIVTTGTTGGTVTAYPTYVCVKDGYYGVMFKCAGSSVSRNIATWILCRTSNTSGVDNSDGMAFFFTAGSAAAPLSVVATSFTNATTFTANTQSCLVAGNVSSSTVSGTNFQAYKHYIVLPQVSPVEYVLCVINTEVALGSTFTVAPIGSTVRTFLAAGTGMSGQSANTNAAVGLAMLWE